MVLYAVFNWSLVLHIDLVHGIIWVKQHCETIGNTALPRLIQETIKVSSNYLLLLEYSMHTWSVKRPVLNQTFFMWFDIQCVMCMPYFLEEDNYEGFLGVQMVENPYPMNNWCGLQCFGRVTPPLHPILVPPVKKHQLLKSYKQPSWPGTDQTVPICSEVNPNINLWQEVEWRGVAWGWLWVSSNQIGPIPTPCTTYINDEDIHIHFNTQKKRNNHYQFNFEPNWTNALQNLCPCQQSTNKQTKGEVSPYHTSWWIDW